MNTPTYEHKPVAEGTWAGVCAATGGLTGAILISVGIDENVTIAAATLVTALTRFVGGFALQKFGGKGEAPTP